jgi:hypothetical protein
MKALLKLNSLPIADTTLLWSREPLRVTPRWQRQIAAPAI